ncbi:MAG: hypothetical protein HY873_12385 [Chloroflexi bacterium]|nr:hypothetical protein [Chloroflexota bacterium]
MRPYPEEVFLALQRGVATHFFPELTSSYAQAQFMPTQMLFGIALRDFDTAAQDLTDANRELRALLADIDAGLAGIDRADAREGRARVARLPERAADIRLTSLRTEYDGLRQAICDLAPLIEPAADERALAPLAPVRESVYAWFSADARKRSIPLLNN